MKLKDLLGKFEKPTVVHLYWVDSVVYDCEIFSCYPNQVPKEYLGLKVVHISANKKLDVSIYIKRPLKKYSVGGSTIYGY